MTKRKALSLALIGIGRLAITPCFAADQKSLDIPTGPLEAETRPAYRSLGARWTTPDPRRTTCRTAINGRSLSAVELANAIGSQFFSAEIPPQLRSNWLC
jgi:hypothetical protein